MKLSSGPRSPTADPTRTRFSGEGARGPSGPSLSDRRAKAEVDPLVGALKHLSKRPGSLRRDDLQALVEAVKALRN